ncbi:hypothetical protein HDC94_001355 [Leifsonia sp. AK011]|uniref:hypothetical protein n=1 Tax=Leifsonia sp. AK011 TaxID=2723075 RepID=UPI0015CD37F9|nr:hypothetical protein [Leifsonia sp. AK011]NYF10199.1 hypothetical protein [Leifsonia sp. AK011]
MLVKFSIDRAIRWPIVIFEVDWCSLVVGSAEDLPGLYEDSYWDEVHAAFDHSFRPAVFSVAGLEVTVERGNEPDPDSFSAAARLSLSRTYRETRWRRVRATPEERRLLDEASAEDLMSMVLNTEMA